MPDAYSALKWCVDFVLHFDEHLRVVLETCGPWTYVILFAIVFCETGLVVTPFLPGDSLLFAAGTFAALVPDSLNIALLLPLLIIAAVVGDSVNYAIGARVGPRAFRGDLWLLRPSHLEYTQDFYERHGGKTIILARFVPIVRTFAPFIAGIGAMDYRRFLVYNIVGGVVWVVLFTGLGYFFGHWPIVQEHYELVLIAIILLSVVPGVWEMIAAKRRSRALATTIPSTSSPPETPTP